VSSACFYADTPGTVYNLTGDLTGNKSDGNCITINASNVTIDCNGYSIIGDTPATVGIRSDNVVNVTITDCTISNYENGIYLAYTPDSHLTNNVVYNANYAAFYLSGSNNVVLTNNTAHDSSSYGFYVYDSYYNYLEGNTAYNNGYSFYISTSSDASMTNNTAHDSTYGFYIYGSPYNYLEGNTAYNNGFGGFVIYVSDVNTLYDNNASNNTRLGFYIFGSNDLFMSYATAQESQYGFYIRDSSNAILESITSHSNHYTAGTAYGLYIRDVSATSSVDITNLHIYNQTGSDLDFAVLGSTSSPTSIDILNITIDNPQGNFENYTMFNIIDDVDLGTSYNIKWSAEPAPLPSSYNSFEQKYAQISGSTSIDTILWRWLNSELTGYDESKFELWKYNASGWTNTNATLNIAGNYLSLTNMDPESTYGILEYNLSEPIGPCQVINSSGFYQRSAGAVGAPFTVTGAPLGINSACIIIASSDVDFSCNGYSITNNGTTNASGIVINGTDPTIYTNVTIRDCTVSDYDFGVTLINSDFSNITNNTAHNNQYGFYLSVSDNNILTDNTAYNNAVRGFFLSFSSNNTLMNNTADAGGFTLLHAGYAQANNTLINNTVSNTADGFQVSESYSRFIGNTALQTFNNGFVSYGSYNVFEDNFVVATGSFGIGIATIGSYNNVTNNRVQNASNGFAMAWGTGNRFINNTAYNRSGPSTDTGFSAWQDINSVFINNIAHDVPTGFRTWNSTNIIVSDIQLYNDSAYGLLIRTPKNNTTISDVHLYNNGVEDVYMDNVGGVSAILNISNFTVDNPVGNYQNYTTFFVDDAISAGEAYTITWNAEPITPPLTHFSFAQKYAAISPIAGSPSIDTIRWTWLDSEVSPPYNDTKFEVWRYNAGWSNVSGQILDTTNNYIEIPGFAPSSVYGILQSNLSECFKINASGSYYIANSVVGAPFTITGISGISRACVVIDSSNVDFTCNGYNITNDGTADAAGVIIKGSSSNIYTNVTIRDCPGVSNYKIGVMDYYSQGQVLNVTAFNNSLHGMYVYNPSNSTFANNTLHDNVHGGIWLFFGTNNQIIDNTAFNNAEYGIYSYYLSNSNFTNNIAHNNAPSNGIFSYYPSNSNFVNNTAYNNSLGIASNYPSNSNFVNNTAYNNSNGIRIGSGTDNQITDNIVYNNAVYGITLVSASFNSVRNNTAYDNDIGIDLNVNTANNTIINNTAYNNTNGFYAGNNANDNNFTDNTAYGNTNNGFVIWTGINNSNRLINNTAHDNDYNGVYVFNANANISGGSMYGNTRGVYLLASAGYSVIAQMQNVHCYDNAGALVMESDGTAAYVINATNIILDNPAGDFQNYTNISINDAGSASERYRIDWAAQPATPPLTHFSFARKYVTILPDAGSPSIDMIRWTWLDSEVSPPYNDTKFEVWRYNAGWSKVSGQTLDTTNNFIEVLGFTPSSDYGILQNNNSAPSLTVESPQNITYNVSTVDLNYTVSDVDLDSCWYYLNGAGPTPLPGCINITLLSLANGPYNLTVFVNDSGGNQNSSNVSFMVDVPLPPPSGGGGGERHRCTDASVELNYIQCPDNKVLLTVVDEDSGSPAVDARILIKGPWPWSDVKYTERDGTVEFFMPISGQYQVLADGGESEDYCSDTLEFDYTVCPEDVCYDDDGCADEEYCEAETDISEQDLPAELLDYYIIPGMCLPVECECGEVRDHACERYECCTDTDCGGNYACEEHECVFKPECESDAQCGATEYCSEGACIPVETGECGVVENHAWYDYECCENDDCTSGLLCFEHECKLYHIETNETGYLGDRHGVQVYPERKYELTMTDPDGRQFTLTTDDKGYVSFVLEIEGQYGLALVEDGKSLASVDVQSAKKTAAEGEGILPGIEELLNFLCVPILVALLLVIFYILFKRRKKKKAEK